MKLRLAVLAGILTSSGAYAANPPSQPLGQTTTLGNTTNVWSLASASNNPAAPYMLVAKGDKFRFGLVTAISGGYELGAIDDVADKIEELNDKLDSAEESENISELLDLQSDFNDLLEEIGDNATLKVMAGGMVPLAPLIYKTEKYGAFSLSADLTTAGSGRLLSSEANLIPNPISKEFQLNTLTGIYVKNYFDLKFSLGWSNEVYKHAKGSLIAGARANLHNVTLGKSVLALSAMTNDEVGDAISGEVEDNQKDTSATSFDLGFMWTAENYQLGVTFNNINEPSFDYKTLGLECEGYVDEADDVAKQNCYSAREFASRGEIAASETHVMGQQATIEGSFFSANKTWNVSAAYDTNSVNDALGDLYQWSSVSVQAHPDWWLISGVRGGYRKNMVGNEFSYASVGATFLKGINFDLSYGLESAEDVPRSLYLSLGIETSF